MAELCALSMLVVLSRWFAMCVAQFISARKTARNGLNENVEVEENSYNVSMLIREIDFCIYLFLQPC
jgi:hypothetical protein